MKKRTLTLLLCGLILLPTAAACAEQTDDAAVTTDGATVSDLPEEELDSLEARKLVSDNLPAMDYEGRKFRILADQYCTADFLMEEDTGEVLDSAVFQRNSRISERFGIEIETTGKHYSECVTTIQQLISSQEDAFDIVSLHVIQSGKLALNGYYQDWNEVEYIDPSRPWWNPTSVENLSLAGKSFLLVGSMNLYYTKAVYCMYYNKKLATDYNIEDPNALVFSGTWTLDKLNELVSGRWVDINNNAKKDVDDIFGFSSNNNAHTVSFPYAFGETTVSKDEDDLPYLDMKQEKWADMVTRVCELFHENDSSYTSTGYQDYATMFSESRCLFMSNLFNNALTSLRDMEDDYGIIPYPKWDENQEIYHSASDGSHSETSIPLTTIDTDFVGHITEAICAESWKTVEPVMYDLALKTKGVRDAESIAMVDLVMDGVLLDFGFVFSEGSGMGFTFPALIPNKNKNFASYYAQNERAWNKRLEKMVQKFT